MGRQKRVTFWTWWKVNWISGGSGQIIATSHDLGPHNVAFWKGNVFFLFQACLWLSAKQVFFRKKVMEKNS